MLYFGLLLMLALLLLGVPIYLGVFVGVIIITLFYMHVDPMVMATIMFNKVNMFMLLAVPFFLLAGYFLAYGGTAKAMLGLLNSFLRHIPGGPAYVIIIGCVIFAAMSSSSMAAVAGFAPIMLPMMKEMGYDRKFSIGLLLASSTLGPMIPPSVMLIVYGYIAEESVRDLYSAAFMPGFMVAGLLALTVLFWSWRGAYTTMPAASWRERWRAIVFGWPVMIMPPIVLVPIYAGWVTPTEAGAVCAVYSFFLGAVVYRELKLPQMIISVKTVARITGMMFIIVMAAFLLNWSLTYARLPFNISEWIADANLNATSFMFVIIIAYLLMGMFLDPLAILVVGVILLLPTVRSLEISPLVYGILLVKSTGVAALTPPYGMLLFLAAGILNEPFQNVLKGVMYFYPALIGAMFLIAFVPQISLYLVHVMHG